MATFAVWGDEIAYNHRVDAPRTAAEATRDRYARAWPNNRYRVRRYQGEG